MSSRFRSAPSVIEMYQVATVIDRMSGDFVKGAKGETILNGGISFMTGVGARGNMGKTLVMICMLLIILDRYKQSTAMIYDTEITLQYARLLGLAKQQAPELLDIAERVIERFTLTDKRIYNGTEFFNEIKAEVQDRIVKGDKIKLELPMVGLDDLPLKVFPPFVIGFDSYSGFQSQSQMSYQEKNIGESDRNMEAMRDAAAKTQMLSELVTLASSGGIIALLTAHMGDEHKIDPYAPSTKKLSFLKNGVKFKRVPENFTFLTGNTMVIADMEVLKDRNTKTVLYPRSQTDDLGGDTDLQELTMGNYRNKFGVSGIPYHLVVSQREGISNALTNFNLLRRYAKFGISGNDRTYFLDIYPEVSLSRTTIRGKVESDPKLRRALEITAQLALEHMLAPDLPKEYLCGSKELYEGVAASGFDWDTILTKSREYWLFDNYNQPLGYLSIRDLLNMRKGIYKPYWWDELK